MALTSRKVILCSRDERTAALFRGSWSAVFQGLGFVPVYNLRWCGAVRYLLGAIFARLRCQSVVAFGVAEMLFLAPSRPHIGVVTGMGRLADKGNAYRKTVFYFLKLR